MDFYGAGTWGVKGRGSYADPHTTVAMRDIPTQLKQVMRLCSYYYNTDSLLHAVVDKMSEYPITNIVISEIPGRKLTPSARQKWDHLANVVLNLRQVMMDINQDKYVFGTSLHYMYYPFVRYTTCRNCSNRVPITTLKGDVRGTCSGTSLGGDKKFTVTIRGYCEKCGGLQDHDIEDRKSEARAGMSIVRLSPLRCELQCNPATGHKVWYWTPPRRLIDGLQSGDRTIIDYTEVKVLEAAMNGQKIRLNKDRLWVSQNAGHPGLWDGWGFPPLFPVLEDVYYYKILRRANEALAQEHVVPMRIVSPSGAGEASPARSMNLSDWSTRMKNELMQFKRDPNHLMVSPIPINVEQIGGQARVMMVATEMEAAARVIAAGVGCPVEMIWGGLNWSGASVSLRILENHFLNDRENCERLLDFLAPKLAAYFKLPQVKLRLADFKMADDSQQQGNLINLMLQGFLSREDVLPEMGYDPSTTFDKLEKEHQRLNDITMRDNVAASHMKTVIAMMEAKAQILMQYELQITQQEIQAQSERERLKLLRDHVAKLHEAGLTTPLEFDQSALLLSRMDPNLAMSILQQWQVTMPNTVLLLQTRMMTDQQNAMGAQQAMANAGQGVDSGAAAGPDMAPGAEGPYADGGDGPGEVTPNDPSQNLPEQRPPQRDASPM